MNFYYEPKNKLKRANGMSSIELNLNSYDPSLLSTMQRKAVENPNKKHSIYFEENNYEYEFWYLYDEDLKILHTNDIRCPNWYHHHIGSICGVCGQKD